MTSSELENQPSTLVQDLLGRLNGLRISDLRLAARKWGWPLRGTARADLLSQMLAFLSDSQQMAAAYERLPEAEREILAWLPVMAGKGIEDRLAAALDFAGERRLDTRDIPPLLSDLEARLLIFKERVHRWYVPAIYQNWVPELSAPGLAWHGEASATPLAQVAEIVEETANLLAAIATEHPKGAGGATTGVRAVSGSGPEVAARSGPLPSEVLHSWGYTEPVEAARANFLVALLVASGLCMIDPQTRRMGSAQEKADAWEALGLEERYVQLRASYVEGGEGRLPWNELDMALPRIGDYRLPLTQSWYYGFNQFEQNLQVMRAFLLGTVQLLQRDRWYSLERFGELLYRTHRDLFNLAPDPYQYSVQWHRGRVALDAAHMSLQTWRQTYGIVVETMFSQPAAWLGFTQVARARGSVVAFQRPILTLAETAPIPADAVRFNGDEIVLRNVWQIATLRPVVGRIATVRARTRTTTAYRISARLFRDALRTGATADSIAENFAGAGFPLPSDIQARLRDWQARAGRYQLYDNVAVIEVADDLALPEIGAATLLGRSSAYQADPRCLVVLDQDIIPALLEDLLRKGYSPRVVSGERPGPLQEGSKP